MGRHDAIDQREHRGLTIKLYQDENCSSPRDNDNLGLMVCFHRRYNLGDDEEVKKRWGTGESGMQAFRDWLEAEDHKKPSGVPLVLNLYLYDHSGITMQASKGGNPFHDPWDSGCIGVILVERGALLEAYGASHGVTKAVLARAEQVLRSEVEEYSRFIEGDCYGYVIEDADGESLDSCWGFIGHEYTWQCATEAADGEADARIAKADALTDAQRSEN